MKLELPEVPDINDISKFSIKRDEKILEKIIKPQNDLIKELYKDNLALNKELSKQAKVVDEAVKYQKERDKIIDKFYETIDKFIHWICVKFDIAEEDNLIRDFQKENEYFYRSRKADKE